jgi:hypothetical protein
MLYVRYVLFNYGYCDWQWQADMGIATQSRALVLHRQDRGRRITTTQHKCNAPVHRCIDGDGVESNRYVPSLPPLPPNPFLSSSDPLPHPPAAYHGEEARLTQVR